MKYLLIILSLLLFGCSKESNESLIVKESEQATVIKEISEAEFNLLHEHGILCIEAIENKTIEVTSAFCEISGYPNIGSGTLDITYDCGKYYLICDVIAFMSGPYVVAGSYYMTLNSPGITGSPVILRDNSAVYIWLMQENIGLGAKIKLTITYKIT